MLHNINQILYNINQMLYNINQMLYNINQMLYNINQIKMIVNTSSNMSSSPLAVAYRLQRYDKAISLLHDSE